MRPRPLRAAPLAGRTGAGAHKATKHGNSTARLARNEPSFIRALLRLAAERPFSPLPLRSMPARWRMHFTHCRAEAEWLLAERGAR